MKRFQAHDTDGSGSLEWGEFLAVAAREDVPEGGELSEVTLRQVFESIDTDGEPTHRSLSGASSFVIASAPYCRCARLNTITIPVG